MTQNFLFITKIALILMVKKSPMPYFMFVLLRPCRKQENRGDKKIETTSFHQYLWNSEVETTWISLICWLHKTFTIHIHASVMIQNKYSHKDTGYYKYWRNISRKNRCEVPSESILPSSDPFYLTLWLGNWIPEKLHFST